MPLFVKRYNRSNEIDVSVNNTKKDIMYENFYEVPRKEATTKKRIYNTDQQSSSRISNGPRRDRLTRASRFYIEFIINANTISVISYYLCTYLGESLYIALHSIIYSTRTVARSNRRNYTPILPPFAQNNNI